ncbi:MAG: Wzt carbohydrate-binding domain-containing protein, partial [Lachnospiraceae bacterium]|nr:Wzt carbohydrate-binding domain-containing protein [Lachnospiraceae bacterium]
AEGETAKAADEAARRQHEKEGVTGILPRNPGTLEYGDGQAHFKKLTIYDENGLVTGSLAKGSYFTIEARIVFDSDIEDPICAYSFKNLKGTEITGTNTMFEKRDIGPRKAGDEVCVSFRQRMTLQGGEYLMSFGCTGYQEGDFRVYHRLYDVINISVISQKNTVGFYDMESEITVES